MTLTPLASMATTFDGLGIEVPAGLWIGGAARAASDGSEFEMIDPSTGGGMTTRDSASVRHSNLGWSF